ncbi:hypothetical protein VN97_g2307 [Penicillium thymicola]|uniref:Uncharacterized protein n=1 Tax=Penicillium thymicola TaxID=293382 RepID=A0AAI9TPC3_PENTH|nr:hypothetical protein VN97_g2307 [Penicillium thymicola]
MYQCCDLTSISHTRFTWLYLLKSRSQVTDTFIQLENQLKTQFGYTVKKVHGDDATEHKPLATYLPSKGVCCGGLRPHIGASGINPQDCSYLVSSFSSSIAINSLPPYFLALQLSSSLNSVI